MPKHVNYREHTSLSQLEWTPGELVGFDNPDLEFPSPFILTIPKKIVRGFNKKGLKLVFVPGNGEREEWTVYFKGNALALWTPSFYDGKMFPKFYNIKQVDSLHPHYIEDVYAGEEAIKNAFSRINLGFDFYSECLKEGRLITKRSRIEKIIERLGLGFVLPNQLRLQH